jgi:peptide deformylase
MTLRKIAVLGHPVLRAVSRALAREELETPEMQTLVEDLIETMRDANGAGLAAPQIHAPIRICAIEQKRNPRYPEKPDLADPPQAGRENSGLPLTVLVNPVIEPLSDVTFPNYEGCLSVPDLRGEVMRFAEIRVRAWDRHGAPWEREIRGLTAGTFQHEIDHLDGVLFVDRVHDTRSLCTWKEFERRKQAEVAERARALIARFGS